MDWLLSHYSSKIDTLTKTTFYDVSPLDIAISNGHVDVLQILKKHYGDSWLKDELNRYISSKKITDFTSILSCYEALFPECISALMTNPLLLPAFIKIGKISDPDSAQLRRAIIGCPQVYTALDEEMRKDPYMIIAFLAQNPEERWLRKLPLRELDPKFAIALADRWAVLSCDLTSALHRDAPPYNNYCNYAMFQYACIGMLVGVILALLLWHFWPIVATCPEFIQFFIGSTIPFIPLSVILGVGVICDYAIRIYPEARKVNTILRDNSFFQPPAGPDNNSEATEQWFRFTTGSNP